ncbi:hypothetical protein LTR66_007796 [Elasticomyces elasticus]|nr:hypothetical protein LTR66_007796 [Elasticomyces elasticus]
MAPSRAMILRSHRLLLRPQPVAACSTSRNIHLSTCTTTPVPARPKSSPLNQLTKRFDSTLPAPPAVAEPPDYLTENELKVFKMLQEGLQPTRLEVQDISGGCGSMYGIEVVSAQFKGMPVIKQHRLVNKILGEEIKKWHGIQLKTRTP